MSLHFTSIIPLYHSRACGIEVGDYYIVTGGYGKVSPGYALNTVSNFSIFGYVGPLPSLNQSRYYHACSSFINDCGETVRLI